MKLISWIQSFIFQNATCTATPRDGEDLHGCGADQDVAEARAGSRALLLRVQRRRGKAPVHVWESS
jgi:hypothetical protein